jgi:hypothetical protein
VNEAGDGLTALVWITTEPFGLVLADLVTGLGDQLEPAKIELLREVSAALKAR